MSLFTDKNAQPVVVFNADGTPAAFGGGGGGGGTGLGGATQIEGFWATVDVTLTRPADTTAYAVNDALSDSTSAPTAGGITFSNCSRGAARGGIITDVIVSSNADPAVDLAGELWLYDSAVTAINDNAPFAPAVADRLKLVGVVPFALASASAGSGSSGSVASVTGVNLGFTTVGSANLRGLLKVKNAYTPASGEVLAVRLKISQQN